MPRVTPDVESSQIATGGQDAPKFVLGRTALGSGQNIDE